MFGEDDVERVGERDEQDGEFYPDECLEGLEITTPYSLVREFVWD